MKNQDNKPEIELEGRPLEASPPISAVAKHIEQLQKEREQKKKAGCALV